MEMAATVRVLGAKPVRCHFVQSKAQTDCPQMEPSSSPPKTITNRRNTVRPYSYK